MVGLISPPAFLVLRSILLAASDTSGTVTVNWGWRLATLLIWLVTNAITWFITNHVAGRVTSALLSQQNEQMTKAVNKLTDKVERLSTSVGKMHGKIDDRVGQLRQERGACELKAAKTFSTREDLGGAMIRMSTNHSEQMEKLESIDKSVRDSLDKVHGRIDGVLAKTAKLEGERQGQQGAQT